MRLLLLLLLPAFLSAQSLDVMTYNLRLNTDSDGENAWPKRRERVADQISFHRPEVLGVQEALPEQIDYLNARLRNYAYVGEGRDGGRAGEFSAIFFDRGRLAVEGSGTFWLSETPDTPSKSWDAAYPRVCTWAHFRDRETSETLWVFNTHFDHVGEDARSKGLDTLLARLDRMTADGDAIVLMGDLNAEPESALIQRLAGRMTDVATVAPVVHGPTGTFNGFNTKEAPTRRIDYLFSRGLGRRSFERYGVLAELQHGRYPSDHFPVVATLHLRPRPRIIGHRGAAGVALENTLASVQSALDAGVDMLEIDVFVTADGEVVVHHDKTLKRLGDDEREITALTLAELRQVRLNGIHAVPTLGEVMSLIDHRIRFNIELKGPDTAEPSYRLIEEYIRDHGWKIEDFHISSFRHDQLAIMRELDPDIEIAILPHGDPVAAIEVAQRVKARAINAYHGNLTAEQVDAIHAAGLDVNVWTVNEPADVERLLGIGVDGFITNYPARVRKVVDSRMVK